MPINADVYPMWKFYPSAIEPPSWVSPIIRAFHAAQKGLDSRVNSGVSSDKALALLRPALVRQGFRVETGKGRSMTIRRPVLFGESGKSVVAYEVDGFHPKQGIVLEIEAGRGASNNADYRDIVRTSLMVDAQFLVLAMMLSYRGGGVAVKSYEKSRDRLDAIYASDRLKLPLEGVLLVGY
jgi:hypothetical protein